jgi:hypothetical protein
MDGLFFADLFIFYRCPLTFESGFAALVGRTSTFISLGYEGSVRSFSTKKIFLMSFLPVRMYVRATLARCDFWSLAS